MLLPWKNDSKGLTNVDKGAIINAGSDVVALENQRYGRNKDTLVNKSYIESGEYRRKFDKLTDNPKVNKALYNSAKTALLHRSGTIFEDMYWIDGDTGEIIIAALNEKEPKGIAYSKAIDKVINEHKNLIAMHTHPHSMPPSANDFNNAYSKDYSKAFIICHDGKIFEYTSKCNINEKVYELYINSFISQGYSDYEAQFMTLKKIENNSDISFYEVK